MLKEAAEDTHLHSGYFLWVVLAQHLGYKLQDESNNQVCSIYPDILMYYY